MKIKVKDATGREKTLYVNNSDTIGKAKRDAGLPGYIWKFNAEVLLDDNTFDSYGFEEDDVILSCAPSPGGLLLNRKIITF